MHSRRGFYTTSFLKSNGFYHCKLGFTLAEVLITLGIIGVVAAMTIPNLIANTNGAKYRSQFKKTLSTLNQAVKMATAQADVDFSSVTLACHNAGGGPDPAEQTLEDGDLTMCSIFNSTLTGQTYNMNGLQDKSGTLYSRVVQRKALPSVLSYLTYTLADGSVVGFSLLATRCDLPIGQKLDADWINNHKNCLGYIDVNGISLPNKEVSCSDGTETALSPDIPCVVKNDANHMTDVFPVFFHNGTVEPASNAAKYVLMTAK